MSFLLLKKKIHTLSSEEWQACCILESSFGALTLIVQLLDRVQFCIAVAINQLLFPQPLTEPPDPANQLTNESSYSGESGRNADEPVHRHHRHCTLLVTGHWGYPL